MNFTRDTSKIVDINDIIVKYVKQFPFTKEVKRQIDFDNITHENIEDEDLLIDQETVEYRPKTLVDNTTPTISGQKPPLNNVVFSCVFKNQTSSEQENNLSTSRETRSETRISISNAVVKEGSFALQIQPLNSVLQANAGFKKSITIDKRREYSIEETLTWTAQSKVLVPANRQITAELIVTEEEQYFDFQIKTTLSGKLTIYLKNKKTGWRMTNPVVINDLSLVFCQDGFTKNSDKSVSYICAGTCYAKYGLSQKLSLVESDIE